MKKNWVGVVADKPWQAIQAAEKLKVTWTPGTGLPSQRDFYNYMRNHPGKRDAYSVNSKDVDAKLAGAATRIKATYLHPYQMHGSIGSSCAVADVKGTNATIWSATQAVYPLREHQRDGSRPAATERPRDLRARIRAATGSTAPTRVVVRRGVALAGRRQTGPRAAVAQGRDGVGRELRPAVRGRSAGRSRCQRQHRRVGLRDVVGDAWQPARQQRAGQRGLGPACRLCSSGRRAACQCS